MSNRKYQIILVGATGYTGKLTARHLSQSRDVSSWAIAGRDAAKLNEIANQLAANGGSRPAVESFTSLSSLSSLVSLVSQARVCIASVGPYAQYGEPLLEACIEAKTNYCDVTGESVWISKMIDKYSSRAIAAGIRLVPFSGFDSVPSDLAALYAANTFADTFNKPADQVHNFFQVQGGGVSGGTLHTMMNLIGDKSSLKIQMEKYHLNPQPQRKQKEASPSPLESDIILPLYSKELGRWSVPFLMSGVNTRVVRRSAALFSGAGISRFYSPSFAYNESMLVSNGVFAWLFSVVLLFALILLQIPPVRWALKRVFPQGSGPSSNEGSFAVRSVASSGRDWVTTTVRGPEAYFATGIFVGEVAIILSQEHETGSSSSSSSSSLVTLSQQAGFQTPATVGGSNLIQRLIKVGGFTFEKTKDSTSTK